MTWWQMLICFWVYGIGARVDEKLGQDEDFKRGWGFVIRLLVTACFTAGAFILVDTWAGITW